MEPESGKRNRVKLIIILFVLLSGVLSYSLFMVCVAFDVMSGVLCHISRRCMLIASILFSGYVFYIILCGFSSIDESSYFVIKTLHLIFAIISITVTLVTMLKVIMSQFIL